LWERGAGRPRGSGPTRGWLGFEHLMSVGLWVAQSSGEGHRREDRIETLCERQKTHARLWPRSTTHSTVPRSEHSIYLHEQPPSAPHAPTTFVAPTIP
jgi:hypothetical protein